MVSTPEEVLHHVLVAAHVAQDSWVPSSSVQETEARRCLSYAESSSNKDCVLFELLVVAFCSLLDGVADENFIGAHCEVFIIED